MKLTDSQKKMLRALEREAGPSRVVAPSEHTSSRGLIQFMPARRAGRTATAMMQQFADYAAGLDAMHRRARLAACEMRTLREAAAEKIREAAGMDSKSFERLTQGEVRIDGVAGAWRVVDFNLNTDMVDVSTFGAPHRQVAGSRELRVEMVYVGDAADTSLERNRRFGLENSPDDVKGALKAMYELDEALPADKMAVAEVLNEPVDGSRFRIKVVDKPQ